MPKQCELCSIRPWGKHIKKNHEGIEYHDNPEECWGRIIEAPSQKVPAL